MTIADAECQKIFKEILPGTKYEVVQAFQKKDAISLVTKFKLFVIIINLALLLARGWHILEALKNEKLSIPILSILLLSHSRNGYNVIFLI